MKAKGKKPSPRLGIALGGGGARGFAHIGVLEVLSEAGLEFDVVTGTSIGSLVGAVYSDGSLEELKEASVQIRLLDIPFLLGPTWSTRGVFSGKNALEKLSDFLCCERIEDMSKAFAAVAVDVQKSEIVTFTEGNLREAIRASCSLPGLFTPAVIGERICVDGGTLEPVPVEAAKNLGAEFVVAVDLFGGYPYDDATGAITPMGAAASALDSAIGYLASLSDKIQFWSKEERTQPGIHPNVLDVVERTLAVSQQHLTRYRLAESPPDFRITPHIPDVGILDFHLGERGIKYGRRAAEKVLSELERLVLPG